MVTESFFRLKADVFSLLLSVLCEQSHDGVRACVKACFQTHRHEGSMKAVGRRQQQRVFAVFFLNQKQWLGVRLFVSSVVSTTTSVDVVVVVDVVVIVDVNVFVCFYFRHSFKCFLNL